MSHVIRLSCQAGDDSHAMSLASQALLQNPGNRRAVSLLRRVREVQSPPTPMRRMHLVWGERRQSELRVRRRWSLEVGERACQVSSSTVRGWAGSGTKGRGQQPILLKNVCLETSNERNVKLHKPRRGMRIDQALPPSRHPPCSAPSRALPGVLHAKGSYEHGLSIEAKGPQCGGVLAEGRCTE